MGTPEKTPENLFRKEWTFNKGDKSAPPQLGVCFSGGGNRSASFAIGVLRALHESAILRKIDIISAVSGGTYALSWLLLQPYYHLAGDNDPGAALERAHARMFDPDGRFQQHLVSHAKPLAASSWFELLLMAAWILPADVVLFNVLRLLTIPSRLGGMAASVASLLNTSFARRGYREGIQLTYQVAPGRENISAANGQSFSGRAFEASEFLDLTRDDVPPVSFPRLSAFARKAGLPSFVLNTTVVPPRPGGAVPLRNRIFELGSIGFGSDSCGFLSWDDTENSGWEPGAPVERGWLRKGLKRESAHDRFGLASPYATLRNFNTASAISGAALSGTNIEQAKARRLLRLLNLGLEYVVPSPADRRRVVRLSDGGHSENLGAYALLRRRCRTILIVDAEHDPPPCRFESYQKLKQAASMELGIEISIPGLEEAISSAAFDAASPIMEGTTMANGRPCGRILYLKLSSHDDLLGDQAEFIKPYAENHAEFPQESTADQYFEPAQFRAYRALGYAIARSLRIDLST